MKNENGLLQEIYKNAEMGEKALTQLIGSAEDGESKRNDLILSDLRGQLRGYSGFKDKAQEMMKKRGANAEKAGKFKETSANIGVRMNLALDSTPSHIAEMVIEGSNMGIVDMTKTLNAYKHSVDIETKSLADGIIQFEENNIQTLKRYL